MTTLNKLSIQGIRSYNPRKAQVIEFYRHGAGGPLTLVVGPNGAGKTVSQRRLPLKLFFTETSFSRVHDLFHQNLQTIIEALKYACTGELPPNADKGKNFVHDPKVSGATDTKGSVKIKFRTQDGNEVMVTRQLQLLQRANRQEFKTLDQTCRTVDPRTGERHVISSKCAEMNKLVPQLMGVSPSIIEHVIFCHQAEAEWVLGDSKDLKTRFDEIFSSSRYRKALQEVQDKKKEHNAQSKAWEVTLKEYEGLKTTANRCRTSLQHDKANIDKLTMELKELEAYEKEVTAKIDRRQGVEGEIAKLKQTVHSTEDRRQTLNAQVVELRIELDNSNSHFTDTEADLQQMLDKFSTTVAQMSAKKDKLLSDRDGLKREAGVYDAEIVKLGQDNGRLVAESTANARLLDETAQYIRGVADQVGEMAHASAARNPSIEVVSSFHEALSAKAADLERRHSEKKQAMNQAKKSMSDRVGIARRHLQDAEVAVKSSTETLRRLNTEIKALTLTAQDSGLSHGGSGGFDYDEDTLNELRSQQVRLISDVDNQKHSLQAGAFTAKLEALKVKKETAQSSLRDVKSEMKRQAELTKSYDTLRVTRASLERKRADLKSVFTDNVRQEMEQVCSEHRSGSTLGSPVVTESSAEMVLQSAFRVCEDAVRLAEKCKEEATLCREQCRASADSAEQKSQELREEAAMCASEIRSALGACAQSATDMELTSGNEAYDIPATIAKLEVKARKIQKKFTSGGMMTDLWTEAKNCAMETATKTPHGFCFMCERRFETAAEQSFVVNKGNDESGSVDKSKEKWTLQLKECDDSIKILQAALPRFQRLTFLQSSGSSSDNIGGKVGPNIESQRAAVDKAFASLEQAKASVDDCSQRLVSAKADQASAAALLTKARAITTMYNECQTLEHEVQLEESRLGVHAGHDGTQDAANLETKEENYISVIDAADHEMTELSSQERQLRTQLLDLESRLSEVTAKYNHQNAARIALKQSLERKNTLEMEIQDVTKALAHNEELQLSAQRAFSDVSTESDKLGQQHEGDHASMQQESLDLSQIRERISSAWSSLKIFIDAGKATELERNQQQLAKMKQQKQNVQERIIEIESEIQTNEEFLAQQTNLKRHIVDNLKIRKLTSEMDQLDAAARDARAKLSHLAGEGAGTGDDADGDGRDLETLKDEQAKITQKHAYLSGQRSQLQTRMKELKEQLKGSELKDIDERYRQQLIKVKTHEMANADLDRFHKALESALMQYHTVKMEEINKIIQELWRRTYRGSDIDTISIHADADGTGSGSRRNFNYRVVMRKGEVELDMRGRCSAGQRVLAGLIVRLALAETFCLNCSILALDEPTANLDSQNMRSFAESLSELLRARAQQDHFQLIIITHDLEFVQFMGGVRDHADWYFRVSMDDHSHSHIAKQSTREL